MADTISHSMGGCFSPYMVISSALQYVFGKERRIEQDRANKLSLEFQDWITKHKNEFEDNLNQQKLQWMKEKLQFQKKARAEQKYESKVLSYKTEEVKLFFQKYLPIEPKFLPLLNDVAKEYKKNGYNSSCPINVILLHTLQDRLDYNLINNQIASSEIGIGNFIVQRWCRKDIAHNSAILNLHAVMENIPTLVISPFYSNNKIHFNVAMWEAQADTKPLIRPAFSLECDLDLLKDSEYKKIMQKKIGYVATVLSGSARDVYMLYSYGMEPTLPAFISDSDNKELLDFLMKDECADVRQFLLREYLSASKLLEGMNTFDKDATRLLAVQANQAFDSLSAIMNQTLINN